MTHTFVSNRTCLSLSQWGTHKANHNQSTWCAWPTSMRAVRQAWPCNLKCIWSSLLHSPFLPVQFWPHHRPLLCPWPCGMVVPMICPTKKKKKQKTNTFEKNHSYTAIQVIDSDATEEMSYYGAAGQCVCRRWKSEQRGECLEALQRKLTSSWLWFFLFLFLSPFLWV